MASKKPKSRSKRKASKTEDPPKFLLIQNVDAEHSADSLEAELMKNDTTSENDVVEFTGARASSENESSKGAEGADAPDNQEKENWRDRDDIRDGLMVHVQERFGIDKDVAEKAINDILRIA